MFLKFLLFLSLSFYTFSHTDDSIKNAINFFEKYEISKDFNIRTARELRQKGETVTTITHKGKSISGYTTNIKVNEEYLCQITLFKGYEYAIIASGDDNAIDIDLFVYDSQGNTVAMDRSIGSSAYARLETSLTKTKNINNDYTVMNSDISVRPLLTEKYWVKIKLREGIEATSDVGLIIGNRTIK